LAAYAAAVALAAGLSLAGAGTAEAAGLPICSETSFLCINNGAHNTAAYVTGSSSAWADVLYENKVVWEGNKPTYQIKNTRTGLCLVYVYATDKVWWESCVGTPTNPDLSEQFWRDWPYLINWGATIDNDNTASYLATGSGNENLYCLTPAQLGSWGYAQWMYGY
jgi:hypothetical protein